MSESTLNCNRGLRPGTAGAARICMMRSFNENGVNVELELNWSSVGWTNWAYAGMELLVINVNAYQLCQNLLLL